MPQPKAVLIITGAWHIAKHYHKLISALEARGIRTICETLPTNNNSIPPNKTIHDDLDFVKAIVAKESSNGTQLTVVAHSWGGIIATGALAEFAVPRGSDNGGVTDLIYLCAFIPGERDSLAGLFGGELPPYLSKEEDDLLVWVDPINHLFNDVDVEEAQWAEELRVVHSTTAQFTPLNVEKVAWRALQVTYIVCENDQALPPFVQDAMIERIEKEGVPVNKFRIAASHSPFLSMPDKVAQIVQEVARQTRAYSLV